MRGQGVKGGRGWGLVTLIQALLSLGSEDFWDQSSKEAGGAGYPWVIFLNSPL